MDHDAAKSRKRFKNSCSVGKKRRQFDWQFEGAGWNVFCTENFGLRQREFGEGFAGLGVGERGTRGRKKGSRQDSLHVSLLDYIRDEAPKRENITQRARSSEHGEIQIKGAAQFDLPIGATRLRAGRNGWRIRANEFIARGSFTNK